MGGHGSCPRRDPALASPRNGARLHSLRERAKRVLRGAPRGPGRRMTRAGIETERAVDHFPRLSDGLAYLFVPHEYLPLTMPEAHPSSGQLQAIGRPVHRAARHHLVRGRGGRCGEHRTAPSTSTVRARANYAVAGFAPTRCSLAMCRSGTVGEATSRAAADRLHVHGRIHAAPGRDACLVRVRARRPARRDPPLRHLSPHTAESLVLLRRPQVGAPRSVQGHPERAPLAARVPRVAACARSDGRTVVSCSASIRSAPSHSCPASTSSARMPARRPLCCAPFSTTRHCWPRIRR